MTATDDTSPPTAPAHEAPPAGDAQPPKRAPGRPRLSPATRPGLSTRDEILEVAAKLFTERGYTDTTTRQIADIVGIKQASLYYHFADKNSILGTLLAGAVEPAVRFADWLDTLDLDPATRLYTLARFDLDVMLGERWNLRGLYRRSGGVREEDGCALQSALRERYRSAARECTTAYTGVAPEAGSADLELVVGLVESVLAQSDWSNEDGRRAYAHSVARGCLRLVSAPESLIAAAEDAAPGIIHRYSAESDTAI
jgi:AcrR family transcriptional regulator